AVADALDRPAQYLIREGETSSVLPPEDGLVPVVLPDGSVVKAAHWQVIRTDEGLVSLPIDDPVVENARRSVAVGDEAEAAELATQATPSAQARLNRLQAQARRRETAAPEGLAEVRPPPPDPEYQAAVRAGREREQAELDRLQAERATRERAGEQLAARPLPESPDLMDPGVVGAEEVAAREARATGAEAGPPPPTVQEDEQKVKERAQRVRAAKVRAAKEEAAAKRAALADQAWTDLRQGWAAGAVEPGHRVADHYLNLALDELEELGTDRALLEAERIDILN